MSENPFPKLTFMDNFHAVVEKAIAEGRVRPTVGKDIDDIVTPRLIVENGQAVDQQTGITSPDELFEAMLATRDHWKPTKTAPDLEAQSFGPGCTLGARAALLKQLGPAEFNERMNAWGCTMASLKPGTPPAGEVKDAAPKKSKSSNPWAAEAWSISRQKGIVASPGIDKAQQLARAAGSFVGATSPKSKQLTPRA